MYTKIFNFVILFSIFFPLKVLASKNDQKVTITLKNGDVLTGNLIESKNQNNMKVLDHSQLGVLTIENADIESLKRFSTISNTDNIDSSEDDDDIILNTDNVDNS